MISCWRSESVAEIRMICDGGGEYGFGNLRRSATLAECFRSLGHRVRVDALSDRARNLLPVPQEHQEENGIGDLWLLDLPYNGDEWVNKARVAGRPVAALDFLGTQSPDLIISVFDHGHAPAGGKHFVGLQFAIIRQDVVALSPAMAGEGVVVIIGGGDEIGLGETAAARVADSGNQVTLIDGPLAKTTRKLPERIRRRRSPPELAILMATSAWGVTGGGGTMLEMMCLGKAAFVVPRTKLEQSLAQYVFAQGAILGVGLESLRNPSAETIGKVAGKARSLVDGSGTVRIVQAVEMLL
jgi:spore coat polysaccharide biosynthesis predicted glycosyltransferase SpsG